MTDCRAGHDAKAYLSIHTKDVGKVRFLRGVACKKKQNQIKS
jgi:hypothetical protein